MDTTNTLMAKSSIDMNINEGTQLQMLDERSSIDSDTVDSKLTKNKMKSKFDQNESKERLKEKTFNNTSGSNAKKMTIKKKGAKNNDDLDIFNTIKVN